eukprot:CAMPEP_0195510034 /NCGR_PEP_ID=MMETSP0794_2-20130614/2796_1 /TAXON_ID=515487 /ORGANISM="Stephanopyxis turris, Strain CCMP 815" /LENGTH=888 /DNA_ID=CAMNT_0040637381 /DNA_START=33 /DNA_END=2699 /DNA_ORIENTATION=+
MGIGHRYLLGLSLMCSTSKFSLSMHLGEDNNEPSYNEKLALIKPTKESNANELMSPNDIILNIVGGTEATPFKYPYITNLIRRGNTFPFCGGSLIAPNIVLSAAHCVEDNHDMVIQIGRHDFTNSDENYEQFDVVEFVSHPSYQSTTYDNDFALLKLSGLSTHRPVCIDDGIDLNVEPSLKTMGWGTTSSGGYSSPKLLETDLIYIRNDLCNIKYDGIISDSMMCAGLHGKDSCQGDSGGPLIKKSSSLTSGDILVGVVSWGFGCAHADYPGVYSRISDQQDWIKNSICAIDGTYCDNVDDACLATVPPTTSPTTFPTLSPSNSANPSRTKLPSSNPSASFAPSNSPVETPPCVDDPKGWYDSDGPRYDCAWYSENSNCMSHGDGFENFGATANQACCACGGGREITLTARPTEHPTITVIPSLSREPSLHPTASSVPSIAPIKSPTHIPSISFIPTSSPSNIPPCKDDPSDWYDADGPSFDCEWYSEGSNCQYGGDEQFSNFGMVANEACCACGGGVLESGTYSPTLTPSPTSEPSNARPCQDDPPGWHDIFGSDYNCEWYDNGTNCEEHGDGYANFGVTAKRACCACGGGAKGTDEPTDAPLAASTDYPSLTPNASVRPSQPPSKVPSDVPSKAPSSIPSVVPSFPPIVLSTVYPSSTPNASVRPSQPPSNLPSDVPSKVPSGIPTAAVFDSVSNDESPFDSVSNDGSRTSSIIADDIPSAVIFDSVSNDEWSVITYDNFDDGDYNGGFGNYVKGGNRVKHCEGDATAHSGNGSIRIRDERGENSSFWHANDRNVEDFSLLHVKFWFYGENMNGAGFFLEYSSDSGSSWEVEQTYFFGSQEFNDNIFYEEVLTFAKKSDSARIRFRCNADTQQGRVYIDDVEFAGS